MNKIRPICTLREIVSDLPKVVLFQFWWVWQSSDDAMPNFHCSVQAFQWCIVSSSILLETWSKRAKTKTWSHGGYIYTPWQIIPYTWFTEKLFDDFYCLPIRVQTNDTSFESPCKTLLESKIKMGKSPSTVWQKSFEWKSITFS